MNFNSDEQKTFGFNMNPMVVDGQTNNLYTGAKLNSWKLHINDTVIQFSSHKQHKQGTPRRSGTMRQQVIKSIKKLSCSISELNGVGEQNNILTSLP